MEPLAVFLLLCSLFGSFLAVENQSDPSNPPFQDDAACETASKMEPAAADCTAADCINGFCVLRHDGSATCECYDSWTGPYCTFWCPCLDFACNNGTCVWDNTDQETRCECDLGFSGKHCDKSSGCNFDTCNHGVCELKKEEKTKCSCESGWAGEFCDTSALCSVLDCENGYCLWDEDNVALTKCQCDREHYGIHCELSSEVIFQRRTIYDVDFNDQLFAAFENGFGDVNDEKGGDLWLGLANMSQLTSTGNWNLRVNVTDFDGNSWWSEYSGFKIIPGPLYSLTYTGWVDGNYDSDFGTGRGLDDQRNRPFSTVDREQVSGNCASERGGGWWYDHCALVNLNNAQATSAVNSNYYMNYELYLIVTRTLFSVKTSEMRMVKAD